MHYILLHGRKVGFFICFFLLLIFQSFTVEARLVNDVTIETTDDGYEVTLHFEFQMRYQSHSPRKASDFVRIEIRPVTLSRLDQQELEFLRERIALSWDHKKAPTIKELTYIGGEARTPQIIFVFKEEVEFAVRSSIDLRSLIVTVKTKRLPPEKVSIRKEEVEEIKEELPEEKEVIDEEVSVDEIEAAVLGKQEDLAKLMEEAKAAMTETNYSRAVQIYTKILRTAEGEIKKQAQEFLGLARERNGQFAHARAEYKKYLEEYPEGADAERVRQRLAGLVTAAMKPKEPIVEVERPKEVIEKPEWDWRYFGNFSQFYFRDDIFSDIVVEEIRIPRLIDFLISNELIDADDTIVDNIREFRDSRRDPDETERDRQVNRDDLTHMLDLSSRWTSDDYDIGFKFTGSLQDNFLPDQEDEERLSILTVDARHKEFGLSAKVGRMSMITSGILGRYDGAYVSYDISPMITINGVVGFPVESTKQTDVESQRRFTGISADLGTFNDRWDSNIFYITQENDGFTDRRALGGEISYFDPQKSFFTLMDYDIFFGKLNIFLFNGNYNLPTKTTLNIVYDYRRIPLLTTNNAILGQGVGELSGLLNRINSNDPSVKRLADERTDLSRTLTFGVTHELTDDVQINGEFTINQLEGTPETLARGGLLFPFLTDPPPGRGNETRDPIFFPRLPPDLASDLAADVLKGLQRVNKVERVIDTGDEIFISLQLINNNLFFDNDSVINGFTYNNTDDSKMYSYSINARIPFGRKLQVIPKIKTDFEEAKDDKDEFLNRWRLRSTLRINYRIKKWMRLEIEGGMEWIHETTQSFETVPGTFNVRNFREKVNTPSEETTELFGSIGYRLNF